MTTPNNEIEEKIGCETDVFYAARGKPYQDIGGLFSFFFTHSDMCLIAGCLGEHNKLMKQNDDLRKLCWIMFEALNKAHELIKSDQYGETRRSFILGHVERAIAAYQEMVGK